MNKNNQEQWEIEFDKKFTEEDNFQTGVVRMGGFVDPDEVKQFISDLLIKTRQEAVEEVTRVEVIDETGRQYVRWNCEVEQQLQDGGKTLKLFIKALSLKKEL